MLRASQIFLYNQLLLFLFLILHKAQTGKFFYLDISSDVNIFLQRFK